MVNKEDIKKLRDETGVSVMKCREALEEAAGDYEKAKVILRKYSSKAAAKKADRDLGAGIVRSYIHSNNLVGVMIELHCETDFVAKNEALQGLADDICMHIAAMSPQYVKLDEITDEERAKVTEVMKAEVAEMDKPEEVKTKILEGKINDYFAAQVLVSQSFVKDPSKTVSDLLQEAVQRLGERIEIGRMVRFAIQ